MNRGFYAAVSAMSADIERFNVMTNNLANINTHGYKKHQTLHHDFQTGLVKRFNDSREQWPLARVSRAPDLIPAQPRTLGKMGAGTLVQSTWTDYLDGALEQTDRNLDIALQGQGFLVIQQDDNQVAYTRHGALTLNGEQTLVNSEGRAVLGNRGAISLTNAQKITITEQGDVYADGQFVDRLLLAQFEAPEKLINIGNNLYQALPEMQELYAENIQVFQGYLERSNVNVADEMVKMVSALRAYQASSKALQTQDELNGRLVNDVGRPT